MFDRTISDRTMSERTISEKSMLFADALDSSWTERTRRGWTTLTSFGVQALIATVLIILPMLRPMGLPSFHQLSTPISLGQPQGETPAAGARAHSAVAPIRRTEFFFRRPSSLPLRWRGPADEGLPQTPASDPYIPGTPVGDLHGVRGLFSEGTHPVLPAPAPPAAVAHPLRLSHMSEGNLIRKVQPIYPALARSARIQGTVVLQAVISRQGTIENLSVVNGHPMLVSAAIDAVRQWRYRPYILNNEPVEVETQITVNFSLNGNWLRISFRFLVSSFQRSQQLETGSHLTMNQNSDIAGFLRG
jgi:periplasmic protein TonB